MRCFASRDGGVADVTDGVVVKRERREKPPAVVMTDLLVNGTVVADEYRVRRVNLLKKIEHLREALAKPVERLEAWRTVRDEKKRTGLHLGREFRDGDVAAKRSILTRVATEIIVHERRPEIVLRAPLIHRTSPHGQAPEFTALSEKPAGRLEAACE